MINNENQNKSNVIDIDVYEEEEYEQLPTFNNEKCKRNNFEDNNNELNDIKTSNNQADIISEYVNEDYEQFNQKYNDEIEEYDNIDHNIDYNDDLYYSKYDLKKYEENIENNLNINDDEVRKLPYNHENKIHSHANKNKDKIRQISNEVNTHSHEFGELLDIITNLASSVKDMTGKVDEFKMSVELKISNMEDKISNLSKTIDNVQAENLLLKNEINILKSYKLIGEKKTQNFPFQDDKINENTNEIKTNKDTDDILKSHQMIGDKNQIKNNYIGMNNKKSGFKQEFETNPNNNYYFPHSLSNHNTNNFTSNSYITKDHKETKDLMTNNENLIFKTTHVLNNNNNYSNYYSNTGRNNVNAKNFNNLDSQLSNDEMEVKNVVNEINYEKFRQNTYEIKD